MAVVVFFSALVLAVLIEVLIRFLPLRIQGLSEVARYSQIWFVFLVVALLARREELIGANMLINWLSGTMKFVLWVLVRVLMIGFILTLSWLAFEFVEFLAGTGRRSPELRIPMYYAFAPVFVGSVVTLFFLVVDLALRVGLFVNNRDFMTPADELDRQV